MATNEATTASSETTTPDLSPVEVTPADTSSSTPPGPIDPVDGTPPGLPIAPVTPAKAVTAAKAPKQSMPPPPYSTPVAPVETVDSLTEAARVRADFHYLVGLKKSELLSIAWHMGWQARPQTTNLDLIIRIEAMMAQLRL